MYCSTTTTAPVVVEGGIAEVADAPLPTESQIENFINLSKLVKDDTPSRLRYMAAESIKMSMSGGEAPSVVSIEREQVDQRTTEEDKPEAGDEIDSMDFSESNLRTKR